MRKNLFAFSFFLVLAVLLSPFTAHAAASEKGAAIEIPPAAYADPSGYLMQSRSTRVYGKMLVTGASDVAVGADGRMELTGSPDSLEVVFQYNESLFGHIMEDHTTSIKGANIALGASVRRGAITVQTAPVDRGAYTTVYTLSDLLNSHPRGITVYSPGTSSLREGFRVRIFFTALLDGVYVTQLYEFRVKPLESPSLIFDLSADESDEMPFLNDGDTTTTGFRVALNDNRVAVSHNGGVWQAVGEEECFDVPGRYRVATEYPSGRSEQMTVYVLPPREDICMAYFGSASEVFVDEADRIFANSDYPTYTTACIPFQCVGYELPPLFGVITNVATGSETPVDDRNNQTPLYITEAGRYHVELKTGAGSGSFYMLVADLMVTEAAGKSVNQEALEAFVSDNGSANGFVYSKVPYECEHITAKSTDNGEVLEIAYGIPLEDQLSPGMYSIFEYTSRGSLVSYEISITVPRIATAKEKAPSLKKQSGFGCAASCPPPCIAWGVGGGAVAAVFMKRKGNKRSCG